MRMGKLAYYCNHVTLTYQNALALAVFTRSPSAYEALKSFKLLQLPSVRTLKYYIDANFLEKAGDCMKRLEDERKHYLEMVRNKKAELDNKKLLRKGTYVQCHEFIYPT